MGESAKTGNEEFGDMLRRARERLGMSRRELAEATGLSYPYISQLETGYRMPSSPAMRSLADALGLRVDSLFDAIPPSSRRDEESSKDPAAEDVRTRARTPPTRRAAAGPAARTRPRRRGIGEPTMPAVAGDAPAAMSAPAPAPASAPAPAPVAASPPREAEAGIAGAFAPRGGWVDNERYRSTASSDDGSGAPMADAMLAAGAAIADPDLAVDEATALLTSLPTGDRLAALGAVQARVVRSVVEERVRDAGRPD